MPVCGIPGRQLAMAVFVDHTDCTWLRPLKRGFRHCFVALEHPNGWVICDSLKAHMKLAFVEFRTSLELAECYTRQGHQVLIGRTQVAVRRARIPLAPLTCVTVAMRALAVQASWVWTPWQLFRHLLRLRPEPWLEFPSYQPSQDMKLDMARK
jgi:hypothetical protein